MEVPEVSLAEEYLRKIRDNRELYEEQVAEAIHRRNLSSLNIYGSRELAEVLNCSQQLASYYMKSGRIPSFEVGRRRFVHAYVVDEIVKRASFIVGSGYYRRLAARVVFRHDNGLPIK